LSIGWHNRLMDREQALQILKRHRRQLSLRGVRRVALFGSVARG
jgi:predicted nucleotidyltransferase